MAGTISPSRLHNLLESSPAIGIADGALIDVREPGEYNSAHIAGSSSVPRKQMEFQIPSLVPFKGVHVIVCDDDGRRANFAAAILEGMGYTRVSVLAGGINRWTTEGFLTEWGTNVISKDFGEKVEVVHHVQVMEPDELQARIERGENLVILDSRTPEEHNRSTIPGSRSVPGGELALRIPEILKDPDATVVVHCAGRTRSIVGARALQRMGVRNVYDLKNGTMGWLMAGFQLETGSDRLDLPQPSPDGIAQAEAYAQRLAAEDGVRPLSVEGLQALMGEASTRTVYLIDVRTEEEYRQGHIPGFRWFPGGQAVQRADEVAAVADGAIVFACDGKVRSTVAASWYRQMGFPNVYVLDGGARAWAAGGLTLEEGMPENIPYGLAEAAEKVRSIPPQVVKVSALPVVIFVDTSRDFAEGHVPGSHWVPRGWLEDRIEALSPAKHSTLAVTCSDGVNSTLAGATLADMGYENVVVMDGGMAAWREAGLPVERGLTGIMSPPSDLVLGGVDRGYADMMNYLRWEEALGRKYETH